MTLRIVGAGLGRTGTLSLKMALTRLLGAPCYHMMEVFGRPDDFATWTRAARGEPVDWHALFAGFRAVVDWPAASFWPELAAAFPEATIVLSARPAESWWRSASDTIFAKLAGGGDTRLLEMIRAIFERRFTSDFNDREAAIAAYERHNAEVRATAPPGRLVEWTPGDGWEPLCRALAVPVPDEPFPHVNTTAEFQARARPT
jgi:hypothetical protein